MFSWLKKADKFALESALEAVDDAFTRFFNGQNRFPRFKSKRKSEQGYTTKETNGNIKLDIENQTVQLPKLGKVKVHLSKKHRQIFQENGFNGKIKTATIKYHSSGQYYVSLKIEEIIPFHKEMDFSQTPQNQIIGLDLGLNHFYIDSNGKKVENPQFLKENLKKLAKLQRQLKNKKIGSSNYKKLQRKISKLHLHIANMRKDFLHKESRKLVNENQVIVLEDLNVKGMIKNKKLARSIADVSWSMFKTFLSYKADWANKKVIMTPLGRARLEVAKPATELRDVAALQHGTSETVRFFEQNPAFPLRAGQGLVESLASLGIEGRPLDPLSLRTLAEFVDSVERSRAGILAAKGSFPLLNAIVSQLASFKAEVAAVREAIDGSGEVLDNASPALRGIRDRLRHLRQKLRQTLEQFARGKDTSKYLQDEVITERNGRYVLLVRAEHRGNVPGIVHGSSGSGASLFLEPAATVEINNDIVELEESEREEIFRILLELTDRFRRRPGDLRAVESVATELDVLQARARHSARLGGIEPVFVADRSFELRGARHPLLEKAVPIDIVLEPPSRVLLITGPNTGGKTVALKTAGLFALMAQSGLHVPAVTARLPVFRSVFADIGDEQSIAASLSTFSAHITNLVAMDRSLDLPALVLLDEVGYRHRPERGRRAGHGAGEPFPAAGGAPHRDHPLRRRQDVGHRHRRRHRRGIRLRSADLRADLSADLRRTGTQPGDRDGAASGDAAGRDRRGTRLPE